MKLARLRPQFYFDVPQLQDRMVGEICGNLEH